MTDSILYSRAGHVGRLVLNNPKRHNSLGQEQLEGIRASLAEVTADEQVRVLIVTGAGEKTFCAGASLQELGAGQISSEFFQSTTDLLANLAIPTVCALNGNVFGGGVELALCCDFRIGIEGSRMRVPAAAIGLCYPPPGIQRYVERLGVNLAKRILMASEAFDAEAMLDIGFLDHLVLPGQLEEATNDLALHIASLAPLAVRAMKEILHQAASGGIDNEQAQRLDQLCADSEDLQEGFSAQREKRKPRFKGK
ncbi:MAG: enoyl-CoA hydratase/isomerase family protein [Gammaproteobacteria bacterium]|nr:MAG: enoyl-CoA hydratase/isomerase family protein [Gammaproteobacteria bacterium]